MELSKEWGAIKDFTVTIVMAYVHGDQAACPKPPVDIDVKVAF